MGLTEEHLPSSEDVIMEHNFPPHPTPISHPSRPCIFLFFPCCINDPSRRLTLPPVMTAFSSFWCDFRTLGVLRRLATKWGYREASKPVHRASVCGDFSLPRTLDACSPRSSGPVSEGGVFERRPPKIKGKETGSAAAVSQRRRECASVW